MKRHALQVVSDDSGNFRWMLLAPTPDWNVFDEHSAADYDFETYYEALNAGMVALTAADEQPFENEATDPVGDADCAEAADGPPT